MSQSIEERYRSSPLFGANAPTVEMYYERYLEDPASVEPEWRTYFSGISDGRGEIAHGPIRQDLARRARMAVAPGTSSPAVLEKQSAVLRLIHAYRLHGHKLARIDPLDLNPVAEIAELDPAAHGLVESDMDLEFFTEHLAGTQRLKLREIVAVLRKVYTRRVGAEFFHLSTGAERHWLRERLEVATMEANLTSEDRRGVLEQLTAAEGIERYLHTRYVGQKRFSLEGSESMIPLLDELIQHSGENGVREFVIGMAHRGRINVLVNVLGKPPKELFSEFEGLYDPSAVTGSGDVKYHMGFSADVPTAGGNVHVALAFNPSHLEIVNPVVEGSVRARQDRRGDADGNEVLPVLIHGDAAFSGQGVVMETFQMSQTRGFYTGGTVHIVCNNQIGFTTSDTRDSRSTPYSSDVAKMLEAPVLHVNGNDPESVLLVTRLAFDYRNTFRKDVVIDLVSYRRHGHNEADEPAVTQPVMYRAIRDAKPVREHYAAKLVEAGVVTEQEVLDLVRSYRDGLDEGRHSLQTQRAMVGNEHTVDWTRYRGAATEIPAATSIDAARAAQLGRRMLEVPEGFEVHPRVARILADRAKMAEGELQMDWGFAENMAYAALLTDGFDVRLTGQDVGRGTFFHRHAVLHNQVDNATFPPLCHLSPEQGRFQIWDSLLSEEAVLAFEYGYATTQPDSLVIWEAQFGDFFNGAQVVVDQFISSGESKWGRLCGLTLLLPHGYEGQGPEHSSARLERFLQLCAEHNMRVCVPSTPAQAFHLLRRQMAQDTRKPLIVMTPKSLLRHPLAVSPLAELSRDGYRHLIGEPDDLDPKGVRRVVFCSGKVFYDLLKARRETERDDVALIRIEQLYPFPVEEFAAEIHRYSAAREIVWCQEEPHNQGAWYQIRHRLQEPLRPKHDFFYAGRGDSAAPASGYYQIHVHQQNALVAEALGERDTAGKKPRLAATGKKA